MTKTPRTKAPCPTIHNWLFRRGVKHVLSAAEMKFCKPGLECVTTEALTPWQAHKKYGEPATCETCIEKSKVQQAFSRHVCLFIV
jgi:hypothetical protein